MHTYVYISLGRTFRDRRKLRWYYLRYLCCERLRTHHILARGAPERIEVRIAPPKPLPRSMGASAHTMTPAAELVRAVSLTTAGLPG